MIFVRIEINRWLYLFVIFRYVVSFLIFKKCVFFEFMISHPSVAISFIFIIFYRINDRSLLRRFHYTINHRLFINIFMHFFFCFWFVFEYSDAIPSFFFIFSPLSVILLLFFINLSDFTARRQISRAKFTIVITIIDNGETLEYLQSVGRISMCVHMFKNFILSYLWLLHR